MDVAERHAAYLNAGDTYDLTVICEGAEFAGPSGTCIATTWGDWHATAEAEERRRLEAERFAAEQRAAEEAEARRAAEESAARAKAHAEIRSNIYGGFKRKK